jgi:exopolysaccharide biosynthesis polyprenyl glycosylphosphotransferase
MITQFRRNLLLEGLKLFDVVTIIAAYLLAALVIESKTQIRSWIQLLEIRAWIGDFIFLFFFFWAWHIVFSLLGFYRSQRLSSKQREIQKVIKAISLGSVVLWLAGLFYNSFLLSSQFIFLFFAIANILMISGRLILRSALTQARLHGRNLRFLVIVGTNSRAVQIAKDIEARPALGFRLVGFVDDEWNGTGEFGQNRFKRITDIAGFHDYLRHNVVDEVLVGLPIKSFYQRASEIINFCREQGIIVRYLPDIFNPRQKHSSLASFDEEPFETVSIGETDSWRNFVKRILDVSISFILILLLAPLFLVVAILIKTASPGPVFFVQDRVGLNKRKFRLCKFRTMILGAEKMRDELEELNEMSGPVFKISDDPRITAIGRFLRKTSIDELPQLFNVLQGDMSLVGPRPLPLKDYSGFEEDWQRRRLSVLPGMTCLWQIGGRNNMSFDQWMQLDLQYIDQWSLFLDLTILAKTIPAVLKGTGAH